MIHDINFDALAALSDNWDGYGAKPVDPRTLRNVRMLLSSLTVVPRADGTLQIEMHAAGADVEIYVGASGVTGILVDTSQSHEKS